MFVCSKGLHHWDSLDDAERCCNGFTRLYVPAGYGEEILGPWRSRHVDPSLRAWKLWLLPDTDVEEIRRIRAGTPHRLMSSTETNDWLGTPQ